jgi:hypothetical protein
MDFGWIIFSQKMNHSLVHTPCLFQIFLIPSFHGFELGWLFHGQRIGGHMSWFFGLKDLMMMVMTSFFNGFE